LFPKRADTRPSRRSPTSESKSEKKSAKKSKEMEKKKGRMKKKGLRPRTVLLLWRNKKRGALGEGCRKVRGRAASQECAKSGIIHIKLVSVTEQLKRSIRKKGAKRPHAGWGQVPLGGRQRLLFGDSPARPSGVEERERGLKRGRGQKAERMHDGRRRK